MPWVPIIIVLCVIFFCFIVFLFVAIGIYNRLVALRNQYQNGFSQIDVQLKRRYDLIPNLVKVAKGYMSHERETLDAVIQARNSAQSALGTASQNPGDPQAIRKRAARHLQASCK